MMVGSVRGNERFEMVLRVWQCGRELVGQPDSRSARSVGGQARLLPAFTDTVG